MAVDTDIVPSLDLATNINAHHRAVCDHMRRGLEHARICGQLLIQAKRQFGQHGAWLPWLHAHCEVPERTARAYMRIARLWPTLEAAAGDRQRVADLPMRAALTLLATPRDIEPDPTPDIAPPAPIDPSVYLSLIAKKRMQEPYKTRIAAACARLTDARKLERQAQRQQAEERDQLIAIDREICEAIRREGGPVNIEQVIGFTPGLTDSEVHDYYARIAPAEDLKAFLRGTLSDELRARAEVLFIQMSTLKPDQFAHEYDALHAAWRHEANERERRDRQLALFDATTDDRIEDQTLVQTATIYDFSRRAS